MTKMTDAFKKVFLGLGGNPKELAENNDVGDYIVDLESAIKEYVGDKTSDIIDDSTASETTVYSSSKVESLIPANELPTPAVGDIGKIVSVVSDGDEGAEYDLETPSGLPAVTASDNYKSLTVINGAWKKQEQVEINCNSSGGTNSFTLPTGYTRDDIGYLAYGDMSRVRLTLFYMSPDYQTTLNGKFNALYIDVGKNQLIFNGILTDVTHSTTHNVTIKYGIGIEPGVDEVVVTATT